MSSNIRVKRICQYCNEEFIARTTVTKYCGDPCAKRAYKERKRNNKVDRSNKETRRIITRTIEELKAKPFLSVSETSDLLGISRRTIYRMMERGDLKYGKIGRRTIIKRSDIDKIFDEPKVKDQKSEYVLTEKGLITKFPSKHQKPNTKSVFDEISNCYHLSEIQEKYGISEKALSELIKRNNIPKMKKGRYALVPKTMIDDLLA